MLPDMGFNLFKGFIAEVMFDLTSVRRRGLWVNPQPNQKLSQQLVAVINPLGNRLSRGFIATLTLGFV